MENYLINSEPLFAFNIWDINSAKAVLDGVVQCGKNVILQTSTNVFDAISKQRLREFVNGYSAEKGIKAWLHLDHCRNMDLVRQAIEFGWDSVMIDGSDRSIDDNISLTNQVTLYAHDRNVMVEAEVGQIKGVEDGIVVNRSSVAARRDIDKFLAETDVDMIAVAFGNAHGMYEGEPDLHYDIVEYTVQKSEIPFVVHGGSGLSDGVLQRLLAMPHVKKINISTEVKLAYREGILQASDNGLLDKNGFQATRVESCIHDAIVNMVESKFRLFRMKRGQDE